MVLSGRDAHILKRKAVASLKSAFNAFNSSMEDGRATTVLLHLQHSFEMLIKASLIKRGLSILDKETGRSKGFKVCLNLVTQHLQLTVEEVGTLRAIDHMRDHEQHFHVDVDEVVLHLHAQASIGIFEKLLRDQFDERLADLLPDRVLPLSTVPLESFQTLIDRKFSQVERMLEPGKRQTTEAKAILRSLIALGAHVSGDPDSVAERDITRAVRQIKMGATRRDVLPRLSEISTSHLRTVDQRIVFKFTRNDPNAIPVRYAEDEGATALREVDLHRTFSLNRSMLAKRIGLTQPKACALRWKMSIESDPRAYREWTHAGRKVEGFSEVAVSLMRRGLDNYDLDQIHSEYRHRGG